MWRGLFAGRKKTPPTRIERRIMSSEFVEGSLYLSFASVICALGDGREN
jgi:hypothetical protein